MPPTAAPTQPRDALEIPISARQAGQPKDGVILLHQLRTLSILRAADMLDRSAQVRTLTGPGLRAEVRQTLSIQLGLDLPGVADGALTNDRYGPSSFGR